MRNKLKVGLGGAMIAALALVGCSNGTAPEPTTSPSTDETTTGATGVTYMSDDGTCASEPLDGIDFEGALAFVEEFSKPVENLVVEEELKEPIPEGITSVYLNNGTPVAALFQLQMQRAAEAAGIEFVNIDTGSDAQSINAAMNTVVEMRPDIVFDQSVDAIFFQDQLQQLKDQGAVIVYGGQLNAEEYGLIDSLGGAGSVAVNSKSMAAGAIRLTCGTATEFVFYQLPEIPSTELQVDAFADSMAEYCPQCNVRYVDISVIDPSPADKIVSDLQAHPETQFFVTMADQFQIGLKEKAQLAGLDNAVGLGQQSLPQNVEQIANGDQMAGIAVDIGLFMWWQVDEALRRMQGMETPYLDDFEQAAFALSQFITAENAEDYLNETGYVAYPEMEEEFLRMWRVS